MKHNIERDFIIECVKQSYHKNSNDCQLNAKLTYDALQKLGYDVDLVSGIYSNPPQKIKHYWLEYEDKILETDCRPLREEADIMPDESCAVLPKNRFKQRYLKKHE